MKLAFDTGGTFTDLALLDDAGVVHPHKVLSTPDDPSRAVLQGIDELLAMRQGRGRDVAAIFGATTVVTNAVLERRGAQTALITTDGFQDILRIRTEGRYDLYDLKLQFSEPLVSRGDCFGAVERVTVDGDVLVPLDEAGVKDDRRRDQGARHPVGRGVPAARLPLRRARGADRRPAARAPARRQHLAVVQRVPGDPRVRPRVHHGGQRLHPAADVRPRGAAGGRAGPARNRAAAVDDVLRRHRARRHRQLAAGAHDRVRPGRRRGGGGRVCAAERRRRPDVVRHGRHHGQAVHAAGRPAPHRAGAGGGARRQVPPRQRAAAEDPVGADDRDRLRRRLHRPCRRAGAAGGGAALRRRRPGPGLLRPGRHGADGDRHRPGAGLPGPGLVPRRHASRCTARRRRRRWTGWRPSWG